MQHADRARLGKSNATVTRLGFGGAAIANMYRPVGDAQAICAVEAAWDAGIRYFDTAPYYGWGLSEQRLGRALSGHSREEFTLLTKVGRTLAESLPRDAEDLFVDPPKSGAQFDYGRDGTLLSLEQSLSRLGMEGIDVALVHDLDPTVHTDPSVFERYKRTALDEMWPTLHELRASGTLAAIGFGLNDVATAQFMVAETDPDVLLLASRFTLIENGAAQDLLEDCQRRGVSVIIGAPFNSGILAATDAPYDYAPASEAIRDQVAALMSVCADHGVPLAAAALQFPITQPIVAAVVPGMRSAEEVQENSRLFDLEIPAALWQDLQREGLLSDRFRVFD